MMKMMNIKQMIDHLTSIQQL